MTRYAAFLRGVSPQNAKMPEVKAAFEAAGFAQVRTLLSSGNVVFEAPRTSPAKLEGKAEAAMQRTLGRTFMTLVRPVDELVALIEADPWKSFRVPAQAKRVVTFLRAAPAKPPKLPIEQDGARILKVDGTTVLSAYVVGPKGPVFMTLLEKTFGKDITTRTWDTVKKTTVR